MAPHTSTNRVGRNQRLWVTLSRLAQVKDDEALRRPFACGVMPLAELGLGLGKESEHSMKMFAPKEEEKFGTLPDRTLTGAPPQPLLSWLLMSSSRSGFRATSDHPKRRVGLPVAAQGLALARPPSLRRHL